MVVLLKPYYGALCLCLRPPAWERCGAFGVGPEEGKGDQRAEASLLRRQAEGAELVQQGEDCRETSVWPSNI